MLGTVIPGHILMIVAQEGDSLRFRGAEADSHATALRTGAPSTPALEVDDR